jgi:hypothetical protein
MEYLSNEVANFVDVQNDSIAENFECKNVVDYPPPELSKSINEGLL